MGSSCYLLTAWVDSALLIEEIISRIEHRFIIVDCREVKWSECSIENNIKRFYGKTDGSFNGVKEIYIQRSFITVVFKGFSCPDELGDHCLGQLPNDVGVIDLLNEVHAIADINSFVYVTTNEKETNRCLTLLFGLNIKDFLYKHVNNWNRNIPILKRDVSGEKGWESLSSLFYVLNNTLRYVVLRGEEFLQGVHLEEHGDIDLLVEDLEDAKNILNGYKIFFSSPVRPKVFVRTKLEGCFLFDLWSAKLPYHSAEWHKKMFSTRKLMGFYYKLNEENEFYSLILHCLVHKKSIASDYLLKLDEYYYSSGLTKMYDRSSYNYIADLYCQVLIDYIQQNHYEITRPIEDTHCFFNERINQYKDAILYLKSSTNIVDIKPYKVGEIDISEYLYFIGRIGNNKVLIKYGGIEGICSNEYYFSTLITRVNDYNFLKPIVKSQSSNVPFLVFDFIDGESVSSYLNHYPDKEKTITNQLSMIHRSLSKSDIIHRNINNETLVVCADRVLLLDFQYAINSKGNKDIPCLNTSVNKTLLIGGEFRYKKYAWDDLYSINSILKISGISPLCGRDILSSRIVVKMPFKVMLVQIVKNTVSIIKQKIFFTRRFFVR